MTGGGVPVQSLVSWTLTVPLTVPEEQTPATQGADPRNSREYSFLVSNVPAGQVIQDLEVEVDVTHENVGDLRVTLVHPDGTEIVLVNRRGGDGDNFADTVFDDQAATPIGGVMASDAPFTGSFIPEQLLGVLTGKPGNGVWRLRVEDLAANGFRGTLDGFAVTIQPGVIQPAGNPMDQDADGTAGELFDDVYAAPRSLRNVNQNPDEASNGRPFSLPYDPGTQPLIVPGPYVDKSVKVTDIQGNPAAGRVSVTLDRVVLPFSFTGSDIKLINGPNGGFFDGFTVFPVDAGGTPTTAPTQYFQISHAPFFPGDPTLAISGTANAYQIVIGDGIVIYDPVVNTFDELPGRHVQPGHRPDHVRPGRRPADGHAERHHRHRVHRHPGVQRDADARAGRPRRGRSGSGSRPRSSAASTASCSARTSPPRTRAAGSGSRSTRTRTPGSPCSSAGPVRRRRRTATPAPGRPRRSRRTGRPRGRSRSPTRS